MNEILNLRIRLKKEIEALQKGELD